VAVAVAVTVNVADGAATVFVSVAETATVGDTGVTDGAVVVFVGVAGVTAVVDVAEGTVTVPPEAR